MQKKQKDKTQPVRVLCVSRNAESEEAIRLLKEAGITFLPSLVPNRRYDSIDRPKPPCLISGEGRFSRLEGIKKYVSSFSSP